MSKGNSGHFKDTGGTRSQLIQELKDNKVKFSEKDIKFITKDKTGQTVWLESGNSGAGLEHIISRHEKDFQSKHGISKSELPNHLNQIFSNGKVEYSRVAQRAGRSGYEKLYSYNGKYYLLPGVGSNGYIVSAYPLSTTEAIKLIRRYGK